MAIARQRLTLGKFLRLPDEEPALEYVDGRVTQKVSPKIKHGTLQGELVTLFNLFGVPRRLARAFPETRTTFAGNSFVPDVVVFRWDRIPEDENGEVPEDVFVPPNIAIEVASPGQSRARLIQRCRWYVQNGVAVALLVDPRDRAVRVFRAGSGGGPLRGEARIELGDVVPGFSFSVGQLFASLRARPN